jgi:formylglycine-generating enzyme required for sulfatase activity
MNLTVNKSILKELSFLRKVILIVFGLSSLFIVESCGNSEEPTEERKIEIMSFRLEGNLQVTINSFDQMTWIDAMELCKKVGNNWRLPTKEEFEIIARNQGTIESKTSLWKGGYWTSTQLDKDNAWQATFEFGYPCEFYSKNQNANIKMTNQN